uniref:FCH and mu domain containing endocytic adaptor 2 n=1 Tax=Eptatretus burgeri TaxID=7764 RepID=A0A8C4QC51_EPTBU
MLLSFFQGLPTSRCNVKEIGPVNRKFASLFSSILLLFFCAYWCKGEKNNGFDVLYHNMKHGQTSTKELVDFLRERTAVEETYSKSLTKLAKVASNSTQVGTFAPLWDSFRTLSEQLASCHSDLGRRLQELIRDVHKYSEEQLRVHKKIKEEVASTLEATQVIQSTTHALQKAREAYVTKHSEQERLKKEGNVKELEKTQAKSRKAMEVYKMYTEKYSSVRADFETKMTETAQKFQTIEESHLQTLHAFIGSFSQAMEDTHLQVGKVHTEFRQQVKDVTVENLIWKYVENKGTGKDKPGLIEFEECSNTVSTQEGQKRRSRIAFARKKKEKDADSTEPPDAESLPQKLPNGAPNGYCGDIEWQRYNSPEVDDEGFSIRPEVSQNESRENNNFFSSSDSDSDDDKKRFQIQIKPVQPQDTNHNSLAAIEQLKASVGSIVISSPATVGMLKRNSSNDELSRPRRATTPVDAHNTKSNSDLLASLDPLYAGSCDGAASKAAHSTQSARTRTAEPERHSPAASPHQPNTDGRTCLADERTLDVAQVLPPSVRSNQNHWVSFDDESPVHGVAIKLERRSSLPACLPADVAFVPFPEPPDSPGKTSPRRPSLPEPWISEPAHDSLFDTDLPFDGLHSPSVGPTPPASPPPPPPLPPRPVLPSTPPPKSSCPQLIKAPPLPSSVPPPLAAVAHDAMSASLPSTPSPSVSSHTPPSTPPPWLQSFTPPSTPPPRLPAEPPPETQSPRSSLSTPPSSSPAHASPNCQAEKTLQPAKLCSSPPTSNLTAESTRAPDGPDPGDTSTNLNDCSARAANEVLVSQASQGWSLASSTGTNVQGSLVPPLRPPSRPKSAKLGGIEEVPRQFSPPLAPLARAESSSSMSSASLSAATTPTFNTSRGPSPLTLSTQDAVPIAAAFTESISAYFKGSEQSKCVVKIIGEMTLSFPAGITKVFANNPAPAALSFRLRNAGRLDHLRPSGQVMYSEPSQGKSDCLDFTMNMPALTTHLKKLSEHSPSATYYNVDILRYEVTTQGAQSVPLHLSVVWRCEETTTNVRLDYQYHREACSPPTLSNVQVAIPVDGGVSSMQAVPNGLWNAEQKRALWKITEISEKSENAGCGSIQAQFALTSGPSCPATLAVQFTCDGCSLSGVELELLGSGYRLSLLKKRMTTGKYLADC